MPKQPNSRPTGQSDLRDSETALEISFTYYIEIRNPTHSLINDFLVVLNQQLHNSQSPLFPFVGPPGERYILIVGLWQAVGAVIKQFINISKCTNNPSHLSYNIFKRCKQYQLSLFLSKSLNWHILPKQIISQLRSPLHKQKKSRLQALYSNQEINIALIYI